MRTKKINQILVITEIFKQRVCLTKIQNKFQVIMSYTQIAIIFTS